MKNLQNPPLTAAVTGIAVRWKDDGTIERKPFKVTPITSINGKLVKGEYNGQILTQNPDDPYDDVMRQASRLASGGK